MRASPIAIVVLLCFALAAVPENSMGDGLGGAVWKRVRIHVGAEQYPVVAIVWLGPDWPHWGEMSGPDTVFFVSPGGEPLYYWPWRWEPGETAVYLVVTAETEIYMYYGGPYNPYMGYMDPSIVTQIDFTVPPQYDTAMWEAFACNPEAFGEKVCILNPDYTLTLVHPDSDCCAALFLRDSPSPPYTVLIDFVTGCLYPSPDTGECEIGLAWIWDTYMTPWREGCECDYPPGSAYMPDYGGDPQHSYVVALNWKYNDGQGVFCAPHIALINYTRQGDEYIDEYMGYKCYYPGYLNMTWRTLIVSLTMNSVEVWLDNSFVLGEGWVPLEDDVRGAGLVAWGSCCEFISGVVTVARLGIVRGPVTANVTVYAEVETIDLDTPYAVWSTYMLLLPGCRHEFSFSPGGSGIEVTYTPLVAMYHNASLPGYIHPGRLVENVTVASEDTGQVVVQGPGEKHWVYVAGGIAPWEARGVHTAGGVSALSEGTDTEIYSVIITAGGEEYGETLPYSPAAFQYTYFGVDTVHSTSCILGGGCSSTQYYVEPGAEELTIDWPLSFWMLYVSGEAVDPDLSAYVARIVYLTFTGLDVVNITVEYPTRTITVESPGSVLKWVVNDPRDIPARVTIVYRVEEGDGGGDSGGGWSYGTMLPGDIMPLMFCLLALILPAGRWMRGYTVYYALLAGFIWASLFGITLFYVPLILVLFYVAYRLIPFVDEMRIILAVATVYVLSGAILFDTYRTVLPPANPLDWGSWLAGLVSFAYLPSPFNMLFTVLFASLLGFAIIRLTVRVIRGA